MPSSFWFHEIRQPEPGDPIQPSTQNRVCSEITREFWRRIETKDLQNSATTEGGGEHLGNIRPIHHFLERVMSVENRGLLPGLEIKVLEAGDRSLNRVQTGEGINLHFFHIFLRSFLDLMIDPTLKFEEDR